jgi:hypothetical protein
VNVDEIVRELAEIRIGTEAALAAILSFSRDMQKTLLSEQLTL